MKTLSRRVLLWLYALNLVILSGVAAFQHSPGYMDAAYYFSGGLRLAEGAGFQELLIWNFMDNPQALPNPSHGYWMPLASIIAMLGIKLFFFLSPFKAAQLAFVLLAACIAPLTAAVAAQLTGQRSQAIFAGLLAVGSGFYLPYLSTTDSFSLYMLGGGILFWLLLARPRWFPIALGAVAGWMYLSRADGLLWFPLALCALFWIWREKREQNIFRQMAALFAGFVLLAGPWLLHKTLIYGSISTPGSGYALWMIDYNDLFAYPANQLTFARWLAAGRPLLWENWRFAIDSNLQSVMAVQGGIIFLPFLLLGLWHFRSKPVVQVGALIWILTFSVMTFVFPLAGARGGFFHSGAALMPLFWTLSVVGLYRIVKPLSKLPRWSEVGAWRLVRLVSILAMILLGSMLLNQKLLVESWGAGERVYASLDVRLIALGAAPDDVVLVNNPPSYYAVTQRPAMVIPNGDTAVLLTVAEKFDVSYVLLEEGGVHGLVELYEQPVSIPGLDYLETFEGVHIFQVVGE